MKTPQRSFVVEFKSGRRLPKSGANSIWGDTDLRAIAREVEDQSSHLFGAAKKAVQVVEETTSDASAGISACQHLVKDPEPSMPPLADSTSSLRVAPVIDEIVDLAPTPFSPPTVSETVVPPKAAPRKRVSGALPAVVPAAKEKDGSLVPQASAVTAAASLDELARLEAENERLRRLLASQLHAQNAELKRMLERF